MAIGLVALIGAALLQPGQAEPGGKEKLAEGKADLVWVRKSEYTLHLIRDQRILASYPIALGREPHGHKQEEGDDRTPEGLYFIDYHNSESRYFLSLHISYPLSLIHI